MGAHRAPLILPARQARHVFVKLVYHHALLWDCRLVRVSVHNMSP
jgi:hypothetical protein